MTSETRFGINSRRVRTSSNCSGFSTSAISPPLIELRVVSLPPTINSPIVPMNSRVCRLRVASECASIETRSKVGGASARAFHNLRKYSPIFIISSKRSSSECTTASGESTLAIATSDHQLSFMRSSQGKSNSVASIMLVRLSKPARPSRRSRCAATRRARLMSVCGSAARNWRDWTAPRSVRRCVVGRYGRAGPCG